MKSPNPQSCLPGLFHHPFCTTHARQASYEFRDLMVLLVLALHVKTPACSFQQMKNLTHLSPTFRIKTFLSILSWILITSCLEFQSDWIWEMCALLTSPHCCFQRGNVCINIVRHWWASGSFPEGQPFGQSAQTSLQHPQCEQDTIWSVHI